MVDAVVVGVADERWGQSVSAVVQPRPGTTPTLDELRDAARDQLAGYKLPHCLRITVGDEASCRRVAHLVGQFKARSGNV